MPPTSKRRRRPDVTPDEKAALLAVCREIRARSHMAGDQIGSNNEVLSRPWVPSVMRSAARMALTVGLSLMFMLFCHLFADIPLMRSAPPRLYE